MYYMAHVYWRNDAERAHANNIRDWFKRAACEVSEDIDEAVKPHPLPFYHVKYDRGNRLVVETFLEQCRNDCVIFSHALTGDTVKDYQEGKWLGEMLEIDYEYLASHPE